MGPPVADNGLPPATAGGNDSKNQVPVISDSLKVFPK